MKKTKIIKNIDIVHDDKLFYGPDQYWYKKKLHSLSGCGPTTAAITMAHLAQSIDTCRSLYPYELPLVKSDFVEHMEDIRLFVKPGIGGLTDVDYFGRRCMEYAATRDIDIQYSVMDRALSPEQAFELVVGLLDANILPALLILRNPHKSLNEYTWHWMSITGYIGDTQQIVIATYGQKQVLSFAEVWHQMKPYFSDIVYFYV